MIRLLIQLFLILFVVRLATMVGRLLFGPPASSRRDRPDPAAPAGADSSGAPAQGAVQGRPRARGTAAPRLDRDDAIEVPFTEIAGPPPE